MCFAVDNKNVNNIKIVIVKQGFQWLISKGQTMFLSPVR